MRKAVGVIPVLLILLAPPAMLWTLWLNPVSAGEDDLGYYYPLRVMAGQSLREGRWPVINRLEATGAPLMADPQAAVMYPATWLFAALPGKLAFTLSIFIGFWLAGGGAYLYLRRLGLARVAATFGAAAFMFCGFFVGHRVHLGILHAAAMLPWGLWCIEGLRRSRARGQEHGSPPPRGTAANSAVVAPSPAVLPWLAPVIFLALMAGHWPTFIHVCLVWAAYFALRARPVWRSMGVWAMAGALAALAAAPQILATMDLLVAATRQRIGFATAGENSFFPAAAVTALFPYLMGNRTPNFFAQDWWGPWNQCEMLGYVGLATLALAGATVWKLYRKGATAALSAAVPENPTAANGAAVAPIAPASQELRPLVRVWTWIAAGAAVWMLGYYLPTYRLLHMIPVLGILRCPARMVLAVDLALATLAAIAIHVVCAGTSREDASGDAQRKNPSGEHPRENASEQPDVQDREETGINAQFVATVRRATLRTLPWSMAAALAGIAFAALVLGWLGIWSPFFVGRPKAALLALLPWNPAVWVPAATLAATIAAVLWWLGRPARRGAILVALLLADLFFLTRYIDTQSPVAPAKLEVPPSAAWLKGHVADANYRVWGLSDTYFHRQRELLLPKTCCLYDVATITSYGPFQSPAHAHLLGFDIFGQSLAWADLLRRNRLISLYNVRYILAEANSRHEQVLQSVRVTARPAEELGDNLVGGDWKADRVQIGGGIWRLATPFLWSPSEARSPVVLEPNTIYRISLDARGPVDGAANFLRADLFHKGADYSWFQPADWGLTVPAEQIGVNWRHFRWTFQTSGEMPSPLGVRLYSMSERPIEVRNLAIRRLSAWESPEESGALAPGEPVYVKVAQVEPEDPADAPVVIYENRLAHREQPAFWEDPDEDKIEKARWGSYSLLEKLSHRVVPRFPPYAGLPASFPPAEMTRLAMETTLPAAGLYVLAVLLSLLRERRRGDAEKRRRGE
jgi:hypothetical protein